MKKLFLVIIPFILSGCGFENNSNDQVETATEDTTAFTQPLLLTQEQVMLLPEAQEAVSEWLAYLLAESEVRSFAKYSVNDVIANAGPLAEIMQNLRATVPDSLKLEPVQARLAVLFTKAKVLEQLTDKQNPEPEPIAEIAEEIPAEFNNLKIQLNEVFLKSLEDFEEELDQYDVGSDTLNPLRQSQINIQ